MLKSITLEDDIRKAIGEDPRVPDPGEIAVVAADGIVTLRGTVGSFRQRKAAVADARKIDQGYVVRDELQVRPLDQWQREDAEIRGAALQILMWDVEVPRESVDVKVEDGWITLKGDVDYQFQSDAVYEDVARLYGVYGVTNEITVNKL